MTNIIKQGFRRLRLTIQVLGPYLALLLLPGGSLVAAATWIYRHRHGDQARS
jgi:hypothetical protein